MVQLLGLFGAIIFFCAAGYVIVRLFSGGNSYLPDKAFFFQTNLVRSYILVVFGIVLVIMAVLFSKLN
jgi:hypothetical protein